jgi:hypothetical protein
MGKNSPSAQPTNKAWRGMMSRCYNTNDKDFDSTGGQGIRVCESWHVFENFKKDMGEKVEGTILRRLDTSANFEPGNCEWQQMANAKTNPLYGIWKGIRRRCGVIGKSYNRATTHYTGRGVVLHADWIDDFHAFAKHVGFRPSPAHSLDRIDNDLGYVPGNLRWSTPKEQANNRVDNIYIEIGGTRRTLTQWAQHHGVNGATIYGRFLKLFDVAEPRKQRVEQLSLSGQVINVFDNVKDAANVTGIAKGTLQKCLCGGNKTSGGFRWRYGLD